MALVELHVNLELPPLGTTVGYATKVAAGMTWTTTVDALPVPPGPVHVNEYELGKVSAPVLCEPLVGSAPVQPPDAAQAVALAELQVNVEEPPPATAVGLAFSITDAGGITVTATVALMLRPPVPMQINEYEAPAVSAAVVWLPFGGFSPLQPPEAVQELALAEFHVRVEVPPSATAPGFAVSVTVGAGTTVMVTAAVLLPPPAPVHVNAYDVVAVRTAVTCEPLVDLAPLQPPDALQELALVELQVKVAVPPLPIVVGEAPIEAVGGNEAPGDVP